MFKFTWVLTDVVEVSQTSYLSTSDAVTILYPVKVIEALTKVCGERQRSVMVYKPGGLDVEVLDKKLNRSE